MKLVILGLTAVLCVGSATAAEPGKNKAPPDRFEVALFELKEHASDEVIDQALKTIREGEETALHSLLKHLGNRERATGRMGREMVDLDPETGEVLGLHHPLIGEVAFDLIQMAVEDAWPKAFRHFHVLTPDNAEKWLAKHQGKSLRELRVAAAKEALEKVRKAYGDKENDDPDQTLDWMTKHAARVMAEKAAE
jgi:hypothetical protein